jgi:hypothetical protein
MFTTLIAGNKSLQKRADFRVLVTVTVTTNTISDWFVDPEHAALIATISNLSDRGWTMKAMAEVLNKQGFRSHSGKVFYPELVGALISKYRRKAASRIIQKSVSMKNTAGKTF